jgi:stage IV sporulation protein FB
LGHSLVMRVYGVHSRIVLYLMGGIAIPESTWGKRSGLASNQQIAISAAGPMANFLLFGLFIGIIFAMGGTVSLEMQGIFPYVIPDMSNTPVGENPAMILFFYVGLFCNFFWGILNLMPVLPLDGGHISSELFQQFDKRNGLRKAIITSIGAAIIIALAGFTSDNMMMGVFFAFMAYSSYMMLQQYSNYGGPY